MSNNGKGGNNRKNRQSLQKQRFSGRKDEPPKNIKKHPVLAGTENPYIDEKQEKSRANPQERPVWSAPVLPANPITTPDCPWCQRPIKDITTAICEKETGSPVHFDCVLARIVETENLEHNDSVCYIGGGRFGIVHYNNPPDTRDFTIKKILEWENKDINKEWRRPISEYFSLT